MSTVVLILGASKGFGKALVRATLSDQNVVSPDSHTVFILLTTSKMKTIETWNEVYENVRGKHFADDTLSNIDVYIEEVDLSILENCWNTEQILRIMFTHFHFRIARVFLFFNSGSIKPVGDLLMGPSTALRPAGLDACHRFDSDMVNHCLLNFVSFVSTLRLILKMVIKHQPSSDTMQIRVVNVSSLAAIQELSGMAVYCAIKAARESIIRSFAMEFSSHYPMIDAKFLNYAPGPMRTDLVVNDLIGPDCPPNAVKGNNQNFISPAESARKCVRLISDANMTWSSGSHIDFFDKPA